MKHNSKRQKMRGFRLVEAIVDMIIIFAAISSVAAIALPLLGDTMDKTGNETAQRSGGEEDDWGRWMVFEGFFDAETTLFYVNADNMERNNGGTREYRVDPNNPLVEQMREKD